MTFGSKLCFICGHTYVSLGNVGVLYELDRMQLVFQGQKLSRMFVQTFLSYANISLSVVLEKFADYQLV